jgi:hypothetical protein
VSGEVLRTSEELCERISRINAGSKAVDLRAGQRALEIKELEQRESAAAEAGERALALLLRTLQERCIVDSESGERGLVSLVRRSDDRADVSPGGITLSGRRSQSRCRWASPR